jgi:hypothetical protein
MMAGSGFDLRILLVPAAIVAFAVVWLACHAINVLILLSPFRLVDAGLKAFKLFLISSIAVSAAISPWLGAVVSLLLVFLAWLLAPWAFRLTVFGTLLSLDFFIPWVSRKRAKRGDPRAFLAREIEGVPARTYGRLVHSAEGIEFKYRPWLILGEQRVVLPLESAVITKGLLYPSLGVPIGDRKSETVVVFRRCYGPHVHAIASMLGIREVRESSFVSGVRAVASWFAETIRLGRWHLA